jgi:OmpA-OmpF porin, OOP family
MNCRWFACVLAAALSVPSAGAQTAAPAVQELNGDQLTSEKLIEVLQPKEEAPAEYRVRGKKPEPRCEYFARQRGSNPVAAIVAVRILFAYDSDALAPEARQSLDEIGKALTSNKLAPCCFQIEGYTDDKGSEAYNRDLSKRRAQSVIDYLAQKYKIDRQRMMPVGKGEAAPIAGNDSDTGRSRNRRVQIVNLGYGQVAQR